MADPGRGFDTIVAGEYERAFCGGQYSLMASLLGHYGAQLWAPDAAGGRRPGDSRRVAAWPAALAQLLIPWTATIV